MENPQLPPHENHTPLQLYPEASQERFEPQTLDPLEQVELLQALLETRAGGLHPAEQLVLNGLKNGILAERAERTKLERENKELQELATHDSLTGLANRRARDMEISRWVAANEITDEPKRAEDIIEGQRTIVVLDLDGFKEINDNEAIGGYVMGDRMLVITSRLLERSVRAGDGVYRLGGDEFVIFADEPFVDDQEGGSRAAAIIQARFEELLEGLRNNNVDPELQDVIGKLSEDDLTALNTLGASFGHGRFLSGDGEEICHKIAEATMEKMKENKKAKKEALGITPLR